MFQIERDKNETRLTPHILSLTSDFDDLEKY